MYIRAADALLVCFANLNAFGVRMETDGIKALKVGIGILALVRAQLRPVPFGERSDALRRNAILVLLGTRSLWRKSKCTDVSSN